MEAQEDGLYAMSHSRFRDWVGIELGDTRQVYARDLSAAKDAPLVFMPDEQADRFRQAAREGRLVCPVPGCPDSRLTTRHSRYCRDHFVHRHAPELRHADFPTEVTQQLLHRWAAAQHEGFEVIDGATVAGVQSTVLVRSTTGRQVALCYTGQVLGAEAWQQQHAALERAGVAGVWLFPPREWYFSEPNPQSMPAGRDTEDLIVDTRLFKTMRREGSWPLIINIEDEEVANLIVPGKAVAGQLGLPRPPFVEDVLHVVISPLGSCTLCKDGIATPAVNKWHLQKMRDGYRKHIGPGRQVNNRAPHSPRRPSTAPRAIASPRAAYRTQEQLGRVRAAQRPQPLADNRPAPIALAKRRQPERHGAIPADAADRQQHAPTRPTDRQRRVETTGIAAWLAELVRRLFEARRAA
jgi:hypothetical protein